MQFKIYDKESFNRDNSAKIIKQYIEKELGDKDDCVCFYENPLFYTEGNFKPTFVIFGRDIGVIVIKAYNHTSDNLSLISDKYWIVDDKKSENYIEYFEDYCYQLKSDVFRPGYKLDKKVSFSQYVIFPFLNEGDVKVDGIEETVLFDDYKSAGIFSQQNRKNLTDEDWYRLLGVAQKSYVLNRFTGIKLEEPVKNLREAIIYNEQSIAVFDDEQLDAGLQITETPERIRGLAGTGKTIVLAMKAARMHLLYPDYKILYTFYTHSLYNQAKHLISKFFRSIKGEDPNWDNLQILHAWGGKSKPGVYYNACRKNGLAPLTYSDLRYEDSPLGKACGLILDKKLQQEYDCVLIDEAQDMPIEFFKLVERLTRQPKRIVWAYDELQTTGDISIPEPDILFGNDEGGKPRIVLPSDKDFILRKSYRNHHKVLFLAVAVGFGLNSQDGIVQVIDKVETWEALGYKLKKGALAFGKPVEIERPRENSPNKVEEIYPKIPIITTSAFRNKSEELNSVAKKIVDLIKNEEVNPRDIMVIDLDASSAKENLGKISSILFDEDIASTVPGFIEDAGSFFLDNHVTLTTARRAKGNESPIVFVIGIDKLYGQSSLYKSTIQRNMAFISLTRAKGWCFISGSGEYMDLFAAEYKKIMGTFPVYKFTYPTKEQTDRIKKINYLTKDSAAKEKVQEKISAIQDLVDLDPEMLSLLLDKKLRDKLKDFADKLES